MKKLVQESILEINMEINTGLFEKVNSSLNREYIIIKQTQWRKNKNGKEKQKQHK